MEQQAHREGQQLRPSHTAAGAASLPMLTQLQPWQQQLQQGPRAPSGLRKQTTPEAPVALIPSSCVCLLGLQASAQLQAGSQVRD